MVVEKRLKASNAMLAARNKNRETHCVENNIPESARVMFVKEGLSI